MPPRVSAIIPARTLEEAAPALESLRAHAPSDGAWEVLVATGTSPSAQRNAAAGEARGEFLLFLDNDSQVDATYVARVEAIVSGQPLPGVLPRLPARQLPANWQVVGGPVLLPAGGSKRQRLFQALLSHSWVTGPSAARYLPVGIFFRSSSESELILCNLLVRREAFVKVGPFAPALYPNEENEWLDRAQAVFSNNTSDSNASSCIYYDPCLTVRRPQPDSWQNFLKMLWRYGMGRTRQLFVQGLPRSWSAAWAKHGVGVLTLTILVTSLSAGSYGAILVQLVCLWLIYALAVAWAAAPFDAKPLPASRAHGDPQPSPWKLGLAAPLVVLAYGLGQIGGLLLILSQKARRQYWRWRKRPIPEAPMPSVEVRRV